MHKVNAFALVISVFIVSFLLTKPSFATSSNIVISQVKVGNSTTSRLVELFNNSENVVDITNWCLYYSSPNNTSPYTNLGCYNSATSSIHELINPKSFTLVASAQTGSLTDIVLTAGLGSGTSGHVYLTDNLGKEIDRVGWGAAVNPESRPVLLDQTKVIERKKGIISNSYIDTDNNEEDFVSSSMRDVYQIGAIYESVDSCSNIEGIQEIVPSNYVINENGTCNPLPVDVCSNLDGLQSVLPKGYLLNNDNECKSDICKNIDGLQEILPVGMDVDSNGSCVIHDECSNLAGIQSAIPPGYKLGSSNNCVLDLLPLKITELLPNAVGSDYGGEFIEIYNPNNNNISLADYVLYIGTSGVKYNFPAGSDVQSGQYHAFSNSDIKFTLVNTASKVLLKSADNYLIDETKEYVNPKDGETWAYIDGGWRYTNRPTPGSKNLTSIFFASTTIKSTSNLVPCAANQYRNPVTNRCKLISSTTSNLVPCKEGQYRSEETNRCRNILSASASLVPCKEGQERNPETNRCRAIGSVLGASTLKPCKKGQERNPETNRCRNIVSAIPKVKYAPEQTSESSNISIVWWSLAGVGLAAVGYGVWEWRQEIIGVIKKIKSFITK